MLWRRCSRGWQQSRRYEEGGNRKNKALLYGDVSRRLETVSANLRLCEAVQMAVYARTRIRRGLWPGQLDLAAPDGLEVYLGNARPLCHLHFSYPLFRPASAVGRATRAKGRGVDVGNDAGKLCRNSRDQIVRARRAAGKDVSARSATI